ncbi:hypothetical protein B566_EDAN012000 [Ephemera danica]|nr:hypothetical protein B566_EDAN012000 [Ephemera danica]
MSQLSAMQRSNTFARRVPLHWLQPQHRCSSVQVATQVDEPVSAEWANARPYSEIPGPRPLPLIGNAWRFLPVIGTFPGSDSLLWQKQMQKYGPISKLTSIPGKRDLVFLFDPRDFETTYRHEGQWPERAMFEALPYYRQVERKEFYQNVGGVLVENGEGWQKFRSYVNPVMMQPRNAPIAMVALDTRLGCLQSNLPADSEPYRLINAAGEIFEVFIHLNLKFPLWKYVSTPTWRRFVRALDTFKDVSMRHIENAQRRLTEKPQQDEAEMSVLEKLLLRDPNPKKATVMAIDMMMAGIDTTSYTAGGVLYHLARNPEQQERLFYELKEAMPSPDSTLTADILEDLKYLKACIKENNRLNPIAIGISRLTQENIVLANYQVPKGTDVLMGNMLLTTSEDYFPKASSFLPERWLKNSGSCPAHGEQKPNPFTMLPFGFGKRNCVVRKYRLEWHHPEMRFKSSAFLSPQDPLRIRFSARN